MENKELSASVLQNFPCNYNPKDIKNTLLDLIINTNLKIIVLDDDPTGIQTVHNISVYTDWSVETITRGLLNPDNMFFILTNSRSFTSDQTAIVHREIVQNITQAAKKTNCEYVIVSRGDSTLRGHFPLETKIINETLKETSDACADGEIIIPFFKEGNRFTLNNIHYLKENDTLIPASKTEFANDKTFGYKSSNLGEWVEEKTHGEYKSEKCLYISLQTLRQGDFQAVSKQLESVSNFNKVIVNAIDYCDVEVFCAAYLTAYQKGKRFVFRTAAALPKVLGNVSDRPLLQRDELISHDNKNGGIVLVGSHVSKTTRQLEALKKYNKLLSIEFNQHLVLDPPKLQKEVERVVQLSNENISKGISVVVYTRRDRLDLQNADKEQQLLMSVQISNALTGVIEKLQARPSFIIAKGGITSSDVGTKALAVKRALVMGQIMPGIPVWLTQDESKFPNMPYIIFPGNVGDDNTLLEIVQKLIN